MTILILGGYGYTGKVMCDFLLKETKVDIIIAGRRLQKAQQLSQQLGRFYKQERIDISEVDASDRKSLEKVFQACDMVIVTSTTEKYAKLIAEEAIKANIDYLDIYFGQHVYSDLEQLEPLINERRLCFITQAGFHPGLPSVYIRNGATYFDTYEKSVFAFTMNLEVESSVSGEELIRYLPDYNTRIYKDEKWTDTSYKDFITIDYGLGFGKKTSVPMFLKEVESLPETLGLKEIGVYTTGFNWFTDWFVFPFATLLQKIKKGYGITFSSKLLKFGINTFSKGEKGVVLLLQANGWKNGLYRKLTIRSNYVDPYELTVIPIIALLKLFLNDSERKEGLWMMGHLANPKHLLREMEKLGVKTSFKIE